jgi:hypothetical protein
MPAADIVRSPSLRLIHGLTALAVALLFAAGIAYQFASPANSDVSWLMVVCDRVLGGQRLYVDVVETNPPMAMLLYMPAVMLEHATGLSADISQIFITAAIVALSLGLLMRIVAVPGREATTAMFLVVTTYCLMVLPTRTYSERDHIAFVSFLPYVMLQVARLERRAMPIWVLIVVGLGAGIAGTIKPQFVMAVAAMSILSALYERSLWRLFALENWIAAAVVIAFAALVVMVYPAYLTNVMPEVSEVYLPARRSIAQMVLHPPVVVTGLIMAAVFFVGGRGMRGPSAVVLVLTALGFLLSYVQQGKGWPYHLFPAIALVTIAFGSEALPRLWVMLTSTSMPRATVYPRLAAAMFALAGLYGTLHFLNNHTQPSLPLVDVVKRTVEKPTILAISSDISIGHPLTRLVQGTYVGTNPSQLFTNTALSIREQPTASPELKARMNVWIARDRALLESEIRDRHPDIILADHDNYDWEDVREHQPELLELLKGYEKVAEANLVELLVRRDLVAEVRTTGSIPR